MLIETVPREVGPRSPAAAGADGARSHASAKAYRARLLNVIAVSPIGRTATDAECFLRS
jgi:hypothetical protein